jgi:Membrane bound O-acyl transferase family
MMSLDAIPPWAWMWCLAIGIFACCKVLTWSVAPRGAPVLRQLGYLFAWPGMDAPAFLFNANAHSPSLDNWLFAFAKLSFGVALVAIIIPAISSDRILLRGWIGMVGVVFVLHFGVFHLLSLGWQTLRVDAKPIMNWPICSTSVSEFWGVRWNLAFRDLTHRFLFRPLTRLLGARSALAVGFLVSGVLHDVVISLPAGGGYGGPTLFFVLQAGAIFAERTALGKRLGLGHGGLGWLFTMLALLGPVWLLFHEPFVSTIVAPFVCALEGCQ